MGSWGWIWMFIWIAALFLMIWLIVRAPAGRQADDPMEILRARFARGEISQDEFERAERALLQDPTGIDALSSHDRNQETHR